MGVSRLRGEAFLAWLVMDSKGKSENLLFPPRTQTQMKRIGFLVDPAVPWAKQFPKMPLQIRRGQSSVQMALFTLKVSLHLPPPKPLTGQFQHRLNSKTSLGPRDLAEPQICNTQAPKPLDNHRVLDTQREVAPSPLLSPFHASTKSQ